jgi:hypothetical protein
VPDKWNFTVIHFCSCRICFATEIISEYYFPISGDGCGSGHYGAGHTPTKVLRHAHDISITLAPDELSAFLHDPTKSVLHTEQESLKNGGYIIKVFISYDMCMVTYGKLCFTLFEGWSENKFTIYIFWDFYFQL